MTDNPIMGFLNVDKPDGMTSHDAVYRIRRLLKIKKVGHNGTLDPLATGVLILCLGKATRLVQFLDDSQKVYQARIRLGLETDTDDREGKLLRQADPSNITDNEIDAACRMFIGEIEQVPPIYSAIKKNGKKFYELARSGQEVHREPRRVRLDEIRIIAFDNPHLTLTIKCSRGTYIRSLARDLGQKLGCGAHLEELRRTRSGIFNIDKAHTLEEIEKLYRLDQLPLISPEEVLSHLPAIRVTGEISQKLCRGMPVGEKELGGDILQSVNENSPVQICNGEGKLLAIGNVIKKTDLTPGLFPPRELQPKIVFENSL